MVKRWKRGVGIVLVAAAVVQTSGCREVTKMSLLKKVSEQMTEADSYAMNMKMNLEAGGGIAGITVDISMNMDLDMDVNQNPQITHSTGSMSMEALGQSQEIPIETYTVEEDGKTVIYTGSDGNWTREEGEDFSQVAGTLGAEQYLAMAESVELEKETQDVDGTECYVLSGTIEGDVLESAAGAMLEAFQESELLDGVDFAEMQIPIQMYIGKATSYPVRISVDMKSVMEEALASAISQEGLEFTCDDCTMEMNFSSFNQVEAIELPQEVTSESSDL